MHSPPHEQSMVDDIPLDPPLFVFPAEDSSNSSSGSSSQHSDSPRNDWVLPGSVWPHDMKPPALDNLGDFSMELIYPPDEWSGMDTDMTPFMPDPPHISIDPSALHFTSEDYNSIYHLTLPQPGSTQTCAQPFQLPTPKAGSNSSRSTSPAPSKSGHDLSAGVNPSDLTLITQLSQKAREAVGVMLAVPSKRAQVPISPVSPVANSQLLPSKMPIPRLRPSTVASIPHPVKSAGVTQPPVNPAAPTSSPVTSPLAALPNTGKSVRPKTSHTTIERRYRTNLNARILALRRAVPALRVLEKNSTTQTQGKGLTGASAPKWDFNDVVNERGYVDGVKAAKKNSKGVVLGKAVEYIRALKRREARLQRELDGLRALIAGLVGGPELLHEWEREWHSRFGGEEADEVDEDEGDADFDCDGDDGVGEEDSDEDDARAKKRVRTVKSAAAPAEKRKRGRPRKHPAPAPVPTVPLVPSIQHPDLTVPASMPTSKQPLLALALIFSLFRSGGTPAGHTGTVLASAGATEPAASSWSILHALHFFVSLLLLVSLVSAYLPRRFTRLIPDAIIFAHAPFERTSPSVHSSDRTQASVNDEHALRAALGAEGGICGVMTAALSRALRLRLRGDVRAWRRVGNLDVVRGSAAPLSNKIQTYLTLAAHTPRAPADNITLALLARTFAPTSAAAHWADARFAENRTASEKLVLDMDVDDAAQALAVAISTISSASSSTCSSASDSDDDDASPSPVRLIATRAILARVRYLAANLFLNVVTGTQPEPSDDMSTVHTAGLELGGEPAAIVCLFERVSRSLPCEALPVLEEDIDVHDQSDAGAARVLLRASLLFRRTFPLVSPTPPPSLGQKTKALYLTLRRILASPVFDTSAEMEEARDRVVDMLSAVRYAG